MKCKDLEIIKREEPGIWKARNTKTGQNVYFVYVSKRTKSGDKKRPSRQSIEKKSGASKRAETALLFRTQ